MSQCV